MTEHGNIIDDTHIWLNEMLDETSDEFNPWQAVTLMEQTNRDVWWQQQKLLRTEGLPSRTDFPNELTYRDGLEPALFIGQSFQYIGSGVLALQHDSTAAFLSDDENSRDQIREAWGLAKAERAANRPTGTIAEQWAQKQVEYIKQIDPNIAEIIKKGQEVLAQYKETMSPDEFNFGV